MTGFRAITPEEFRALMPLDQLWYSSQSAHKRQEPVPVEVTCKMPAPMKRVEIKILVPVPGTPTRCVVRESLFVAVGEAS